MERVKKKLPGVGKKKYLVITSYGRKISFGHRDYEQCRDLTPLQLYKNKNHNDPKRRKSFLKRHAGVSTKREALQKLKENTLTARYLSVKYLW